MCLRFARFDGVDAAVSLLSDDHEDAVAASDRRQDAARNGVITSLTSSKVQLLNDKARLTSAPRCFRCMATSSIMPTPLLSTARRKSSKSPKGVSLPPHSPNLSMYPKCFGSDAPVAEQYTTLARGRAVCNFNTACPVLVGLPPLPPNRFLALCDSSKSRPPSKPGEAHSSS